MPLFIPSDGIAINARHVDRIVLVGTRVEVWTLAVHRSEHSSYPAWSRDYAPKTPITMTTIERERAYEVARASAKAEWWRLTRYLELTLEGESEAVLT